MNVETYTLRQASVALGVPTYTLRKFCDRGLISGVRRKRGGYRVLNQEQLNRAWLLENLRKIGFSYADMKKFMRMEQQGVQTLAERKAMLETKKRQIWQQVQDLQAGIDFIERQTELLDRNVVIVV